MGNAIKLSGRTFLAPHRGSCPKGLRKRTGFLGVKRRENPVRRHFERSEMRGQHYGVSNIVRWPLACPYCLRHFPRGGKQGICEMTESVESPWLPIGGAARRAEGAALRYIPHCSITASMPLLSSALPPKGEARCLQEDVFSIEPVEPFNWRRIPCLIVQSSLRTTA